MSILDLVQQQLGPRQMEQIGQQLGTDAAATRQAVDVALPALVAGMANVAQQPGGADEIRTLAGSPGGAQAFGGLGDLGAMMGGGGAGGVLGSILGGGQPAVEDGVKQASGLDSARTRQLLAILAPIVLSALAKRGMGGGDSTSTAGGGGPLGGALGRILGGLGG